MPSALLTTAQANAGEGGAKTLRIALERLNHAEWCKQMMLLEGQIQLDIDL